MPDDITQHLPRWQEQPTPFQSDDPVAPVQIHGEVEEAFLDTEPGGSAGAGALDTDDDNAGGGSPMPGLTGPADVATHALVARYIDYSTGSPVLSTGTFAEM